jgi:hypothetical protein
MFDHLFEFLKKHDIKKAITHAIAYAPKKYHDVLLKNAVIGASVADRATLIGAIYGQIEKPQEL